MKNNFPRHTFYVQGIHCASCEILIRDLLSQHPCIEKYSFTKQQNQIEVTFNDPQLVDEKLALILLQKAFAQTNYIFSVKKIQDHHFLNIFLGLILALILTFLLHLLNQQQLLPQPQLDQHSNSLAFLIFGFLASISSCAALVGGLIISLSQTWFQEGKSKWLPIISFQAGRILTFVVSGFILGGLGHIFQINPLFNSMLLLAVAFLMILSGLDFMGLAIWRRLFRHQSWASFNTSKKKSAFFWPALVGAITFFIPCGFTATVQLLALSSQDPFKAALFLLAFVLGTVPVLVFIAYSGSLWQSKATTNNIINYALGIIILIFGFNTLNNQLRILGWFNFSSSTNSLNLSKQLIPLTDNVQVLKLTADATGYHPQKVVVRAKTKTRLEIKDLGTKGCTNAIIAPDFFPEKIPLTVGQTTVKEFTTPETGTYQISCWMNMVAVTVEVI